MAVASIFQLIGWMLLFISVGMALPATVALQQGDVETAAAFGLCGVITGFVGGAVALALKDGQRISGDREGIALVCLSWLIVPIFAALPLAVLEGFPTLLDAWFEAVSGLTTTGATRIVDYDIISIPVFLWRAFLQWIGGFGVILMATHVLTTWSASSLPILRPKLPTYLRPSEHGDLLDRLKQTAFPVGLVYTLITFLGFILLVMGGLPAWKALCYAMSTISTGGFLVPPETNSLFGSMFNESVIILLMLFGSTSFLIHTHLLRGKRDFYTSDREGLQIFIMLILVLAVVLMTDALYAHNGIWTSIFLAVSLFSTTGIAIDIQSQESNLPLMFWMMPVLIGGAVASTSGGIKVMRIAILFQHGWQEMKRLAHPHTILSFRYNDRLVTERTMIGIWGFLIGILCLISLTAMAVSAYGFDFSTSIAAATASVVNAGPMLVLATDGQVTYAHFPRGLTGILGLAMIFGRVEILAFLALFNRSFWRH